MTLYTPEAGETCLVQLNYEGAEWEKCTVNFMGEYMVVISKKGLPELCLEKSSVNFQPISKGIDDMLDTIRGITDPYDCCKALYDKGYRRIQKKITFKHLQ